MMNGDEGRVGMGRGIANSGFYIMGWLYDLWAGGVGGELVIGGKGVGRGYWNVGEERGKGFVGDGFYGGEGM